ncbi:MAG: MAPEG family protein [Bacteriovoracaceae bacterium]|nr:MAPEG family protein [Bacteriovoracaceae bacterium]
MNIVGLYCALLTIVYLVLSFRTIGFRRKLRVALGDDKNISLTKAIRAHCNFSEYVPLALLAISFVAQQGAASTLIHALGSALLIGRISHAYGISQIKEDLRFRQLGMLLTFSVLITSCLFLIYKFFI